MNIVNDLMFGVIGYLCGHLFSCDYMYKNRQYVLQRLYFEQGVGVKDRTLYIQTPGLMLDEYPLRGEGIALDS